MVEEKDLEKELRAEIIDDKKARADFQKWKLVLVAALGAAALGLGSDGHQNQPFLLCGIPLVCAYVDLLCKHITLRIMVIGTYLRKLNAAKATPGALLDYEGFVQKARKEKINPYGLEDWVMHGSTLLLSVGVAVYGVQHCPCWRSILHCLRSINTWSILHCLGWIDVWPYLLSGTIGIVMVVCVHFVGKAKEGKLEALDLKPKLRLQQLIKPEYRLQDLAEIEHFLEQRQAFDLYPVANHLYAAVTGLSSDSTTGYQDVWLRDNVMVANWFRLRGYVELAKQTMQALTSLLRTQADRFKVIIVDPTLKLEIQNRPHVRFNAVDGTSDPSWSHAQNDALGYTLWLRFVMANSGQLELDDSDYELYRLFPLYFKAISYWEDADSGAWEEDLKVNSSSIGVVVAGLRAMETYLQGTGGATWKDRDGLLQMIRDLVGKGLAHLEQSLPCESPPLRCADGALLFLIYPVNVLSPEHEDLVLKIVKSDLVREIGTIRYVGDSYFGQDYPEWFSEEELTADFSGRIAERNKLLRPGYEAQWCIFDPIISIIHGYRFLADPANKTELAEQTHFLNRALRQLTEDAQCPELYYCRHGEWVPNSHTPLAWTQANLALALHVMRRSLTLG